MSISPIVSNNMAVQQNTSDKTQQTNGAGLVSSQASGSPAPTVNDTSEDNSVLESEEKEIENEITQLEKNHGNQQEIQKLKQQLQQIENKLMQKSSTKVSSSSNKIDVYA